MGWTHPIPSLPATTLGLMLSHDAGAFFGSGARQAGNIVIRRFRGVQHGGHWARPARGVEGSLEGCDVQDSPHIFIAHADKVTREEGQ